MITTSVISGWALPVVYLAAVILALGLKKNIWVVAQSASLVGIGCCVAAWLGLVTLAPSTDMVGLVMASLVSVLGWVIIRYSRRYLDGEAGQPRYVAALLVTLAAVSAVVLSRNLAVLVIAWTVTSIGLHQLLTFYRDRLPAQIAAHKKFIASRLAEVCLVLALVLIYLNVGSLDLAAIAQHVKQAAGLTTGLQAAALLVALAAIVKTAQLPLHGWLIQVMEAPTPVSALLHAGVVNLGGFVLIRLAELISAVPAAQTLLVVAGSVTAVLAGLVMMTRISIKVRLAWSTCAQMGFMLMECGLGLYDLALLHLVAHSLYKAYAFLSAGEIVAQVRNQDLHAAEPDAKPAWLFMRGLMVLPLSGGFVVGSIWIWQQWLPTLSVAVSAVAIIALGLAPLLWIQTKASMSMLLIGTARAVGLIQLYLLWHVGASAVLPTQSAPPLGLSVFVITSFAALYLAQVWLQAYPKGSVARLVYPWAYGGFYLDERFTRFTFRVWPVPRATSRTPMAEASRSIHSAPGEA